MEVLVKKQRPQKEKFTASEPSSNDSRPQTSMVAHVSTKEEMRKESDPQEDSDPETAIQPERYTLKQQDVMAQLPRHILQEPVVQKLADCLQVSSNEVSVFLACIIGQHNCCHLYICY